MNRNQAEFIAKNFRTKSINALTAELGLDRKQVQAEVRRLMAEKPAAPEPAHPGLFTGVALALFFVLGLLNILHHEMWRDEVVMWLIARDSGSFAEMLRVIKYGGHPAMWFAALYGLKHFTLNPAAMQYFHLFLAAAAALIFLRFSPFSKTEKGLFLLGYFPFYEYCVKSRSYILGVILLYAACCLYRDRKRHYPLLGLVLFLLCHTSVLGLILAGAFGAAVLFDFIGEWAKTRDRAFPWLFFLAGGGVLAAGILTAVIQLRPPADSGFYTEWYFGLNARRLADTLATLRVAFIPTLGDMFLKGVAETPDLAAAPVLLTLALSVLAGRWPAFIFYGLSAAGILSFFYVKYPGFIWHHGHLFLAWIAAVWIARAEEPSAGGAPGKFAGWRRWVLLGILGWHVVPGVGANALDWARPYSAGEAAAAYIKKEGLDRLPIVADLDIYTVTVVGYLNKEVYYPRPGRFGTYYIMDQKRNRKIVPEDIFREAGEIARKDKTGVLILLNYDLVPVGGGRAEDFLPPNLRKIAEFTDSLWEDERYYLFKMDYAA
jgi:hypothetical protein